MPLDELKNSNKVVGTKQVKKAIGKGLVKRVYIAGDAEPHIIEPLKLLCSQAQVDVIMVEKMKILGELCGIEVGSAAVALLNGEK